MKNFKNFGVMIDMSRNAVMSVDSLKIYLPLLKKMGYNCAMLYTEDTYEVDGEPYFGYMRGRYSKEEMKELDAFATSIGMTLIPCIQTLAHLNATFRWWKIPRDCDDILLTDDERTYEFIDHMFATLSECFKSRIIHVGMDEAQMLGRGRHLDLHGYEDANSIIKRHLAKVVEIGKKYDYEIMIWSDMFFRPWNNGRYGGIPKTQVPQGVIDSLPKEVIPVYWDYYQTEEKKYSDMIENHKQLSNKTWFAGGAWCWRGLVPYNRFTIESMLPALDACKKHKIKNVFMTMWGDDGAECSHFSQLPSLFYLAEYAKGNTDEEKIKAKFKRITGIDYDEFSLLDCPNEVLGYDGSSNPSKYMLYSDYFLDFLDYTVKPGAGEKYKEFAAQLHAIAKKSRKYGYLFDTEAKLCDVLAIKYELGLRTRRAYEAGDKAELERLAKNEYVQVEKLMRIFGKAFEKQWFKENKTHGFDIQDHRLGSIIYRTDACRRRILDYVNGKIDKIEELDEALLALPYSKAPETSITVNNANLYSSTNLFAMMSLPL